MKPISRKLLTATAAASLIALTGCGMGGPSVEEPPQLSEIDELIWETVAEHDSVTLSTDMETITEGQDNEMITQLFGEDASFSLYGPLDGSATGVSIGDSDLVRVFGQDEAFMSSDALFMMIESQMPSGGEAQQQQLDSASEEFADTWIDISSEFSASNTDTFNFETLFADFEADWKGEADSENVPVDRDEISDEGTHEIRDDIDVWVYPGENEGQELVLIADHDAPIFYDYLADGEVTQFRNWGETEAPERPADENVITQDEAQQQIMEALMSAAMGQ